MGLDRTFNMLKNIENWTEYLAYKFGGKKKPNFVFKLRNKFSVTVPRNIIPEFKESVFEQVYFKNLPKEIFNIKKPTIIDIGANVGFFSLISVFKFNEPRVISFEPIKRNFEILQNNIKSANHDQLTIVNKAVNDVKGELVLKFNNAQDITTTASLFDNQFGSYEEVVTTTTLEDIFLDYKLSKIDILKLDCEGAEYNIFYKTPAQFFEKVNCIALETHNGKDIKENNAALASYIKSLGFKVLAKPDLFIWAYKDPKNWV